MEQFLPSVARVAITIFMILAGLGAAAGAQAGDPIRIGFGMSLTGGLAMRMSHSRRSSIS